MTSLESKGRAFIEQYKLPNNLEIFPGTALTTENLLPTFRCSLIADHQKTDRELPPTASRARGRPHLPKGVMWPERTYFEAQLDVAEIASFALWDHFPKAGTIYVFFDPETTRAELVHTLSTPELLTEPPAALPYDGKYYQNHFLKNSYPLRFRPMFSLGFGETVPKALILGLEEELGFKSGEATSAEIGGEPVCYQGEEDDLFADEEWDWTEGAPPDPERFLLFQDDFGEGHAHFWVPNAELKSATFTTIDVTYSGT